ncbi:protein of unknown function [Tenacibaculum sp. 190130A14a]|uniref:Uncharacterized protein n=1 Tax=Tenacibaculum polynesiense TaxID=3137857 RepID=A0ABP1EU91_9FLAO
MKLNKNKRGVIFLIIITVFGFYKIFEQKVSKDNSKLMLATVTGKSCSSGTFGHSSSIWVKYAGKRYLVYLNYSKCKKLKIDDELELLYSEIDDKFYDKDKKVLYFF